LPVVFYGHETRSLILSEERGLRVLENRVLRRIFGSKRGKVTRGWRKLHNVELHNLYSIDNIIRVAKSRRKWWALHIACTDGDKGKCVQKFGENPQGKGPLLTPRHR
jgi:hypothetical protein